MVYLSRPSSKHLRYHVHLADSPRLLEIEESGLECLAEIKSRKVSLGQSVSNHVDTPTSTNLCDVDGVVDLAEEHAVGKGVHRAGAV